MRELQNSADGNIQNQVTWINVLKGTAITFVVGTILWIAVGLALAVCVNNSIVSWFELKPISIGQSMFLTGILAIVGLIFRFTSRKPGTTVIPLPMPMVTRPTLINKEDDNGA